MGRRRRTNEDGMNTGEWTAEEDQKLVVYINEYGPADWLSLPERAGLRRCGKSCRLRWLNYLQPGIKRGKFTPQEEEEIIKLHSLLGNRWASIANQMPNRTDNDIKNHWHSCLKKRLVRHGIDPVTHEPMVMTVEATPTSTTSSPTLTPGHSSSTSSSSIGYAPLLNKLAAGISSRKHDLERIKTVILSQPRQAYTEEEEITMTKEDEEIFASFMGMSPTTNFVADDPNHDYSLSIDPCGLY